MASISINPVPEDLIDVDLPHSGKQVSVSIPPLDCLKPSDMAKALNTSQEVGVEDGTPEFYRHLLHVFATTKDQKAAVENMTIRQLIQFSEAWHEATEVSLGESSGSTDSSKSGKD